MPASVPAYIISVRASVSAASPGEGRYRAARDAWEHGPWRAMSGTERGALLFERWQLCLRDVAELAAEQRFVLGEWGALKAQHRRVV